MKRSKEEKLAASRASEASKPSRAAAYDRVAVQLSIILGEPLAKTKTRLAGIGGLTQLAGATHAQLDAAELDPNIVLAVLAFAREYREWYATTPDVLDDPNGIWRMFSAEGAHLLTQEHFWVVSLDVRNNVRARELVGLGNVNGVETHPREVFRAAIRANAAAIVLVHNHPSGDPKPSVEDIELTKRLRGAGALVGVPVVDHVIISRGGMWSIASSSKLFDE